MLFRVYVEKELVMEKVRLIKGTPEGVALKDDKGVSQVIDGVYIAEMEGVAGYVILHHGQPVGQGS
jgi:predicted RNA-binding protein